PSIGEHPYGIVIAGVGGTGVTTLGAVLGMAAHLESLGASVLDMTGLAQKFGAVITHLQISDEPEKIYASRIAAGGARLLLGCDLVVAASNDSTVKLNPETAHAVVNSHVSMTAEFTRNPDSHFPGAAMQALIAESAGENNTVFLEVNDLVESLLGGNTASNIFLAGYAWQQGLIPISAAAILRAIELNGVSIEENQLAFEYGRYYAHDPETVLTLAGHQPDGFKPLTRLEDIVSDRSRFLAAYQNTAYAQTYTDFVGEVSKADPDGDKRFTKKVARNLFKLMAYKDEYEVARLFATEDFKAMLATQFAGPYRLNFHLATPLLAKKDPATGQARKRAFGQWMLPLFRLLQHFKFLRGTAFDPFAYTRERKAELALVNLYKDLITTHLVQLKANKGGYETLVELAAVPEKIRGFGHIKERSISQARQTIDRLVAELNQEQPIRLVTADESTTPVTNTEKEYHVG
ncbi:MAG: 2-oxoacid:acceptor oxidoreductase family protein, partial [Gammaproteobacteria bacterium]|nr:2-oxoacid:acceptor oxidoreductase family protein [Gammaproteobacteria bacterium]